MKRRDDGFILVAIIWIIAILTILTLGFAHRALLDQRAAALSLDHAKAQYLARGAVEYAVADVRNRAVVQDAAKRVRATLAPQQRVPYSQRRRGNQSPPGTSLPLNFQPPDLYVAGQPFAGATTTGTDHASYDIADAESRISLNTAPKEILDNIEGLSFRTVSAIMEHRGSDLTPEERGLFLTVEEGRYLEGVEEDDWEGDDENPGLRDLFTVYGSGRVNVNSAPREVLVAIPELDESVVDQIIAYRDGEDHKHGTADDESFASLPDLAAQVGVDPTALAPITRFCTFESHYFTITGFATQRQGKVRAAAQAVVQLETGKADVLAWSEGEFGPKKS